MPKQASCSSASKEPELKHGQYEAGSEDFWTPRILKILKETKRYVLESIKPELSFEELIRLQRESKKAEKQSQPSQSHIPTKKTDDSLPSF